MALLVLLSKCPTFLSLPGQQSHKVSKDGAAAIVYPCIRLPRYKISSSRTGTMNVSIFNLMHIIHIMCKNNSERIKPIHWSTTASIFPCHSITDFYICHILIKLASTYRSITYFPLNNGHRHPMSIDMLLQHHLLGLPGGRPVLPLHAPKPSNFSLVTTLPPVLVTVWFLWRSTFFFLPDYNFHEVRNYIFISWVYVQFRPSDLDSKPEKMTTERSAVLKTEFKSTLPSSAI